MNDIAQELQQAKAVIEWQKETINGLDRRTREYQEECARLQERIDSLQEALAGIPTRDTNETIEAQAKRIAHQEAVIKQYRQEMQALQRKVDEQDKKIKQLKLKTERLGGCY